MAGSKSWCAWAGVCVMVGLTAATGATAADRYVGTAYARDGGKLIYREVHYDYQADGEARQLVMYQCPDGRAFGRKLLHDSPTSAAPDFDFEDARLGYREGVRGSGSNRTVYTRKSAQASAQQAPLPQAQDLVVDAGFDTYVHEHWKDLDGAGREVAFLLPAKLKTVPIKLNGAHDTEENGERVRKLSMKLDAWYGFAVAPIELTYDSADHRLRRFEGVGTVRSRDGDNLDLRIEFPASDRRADVAQSEIDTALKANLVNRCGA